MEVSISDIRDHLTETINQIADSGERLVLLRRGKRVAALVSLEDWQLLEELENRADLKAARKARKEKGGVPLENIKKRLGMK